MCDKEAIFIQEHMQKMQNMYTSAPGLILHCSEFIWGIWNDIVVSYLHMN